MTVQILVIQGSILEAEAQAIVNAANSSGAMGGGVAGAIRRTAGSEVETEAMQQAPIPVGHAIVTSSGNTLFQGIIHAPTMPKPAMRIPADNVGKATRAALTVADERGFSSLAIPGMGTGVGGVIPADAAARMIKEIKSFVPRTLTRVILIDVDPTMVKAWREHL
jgi:O-acetyl-ADP-ribose deacetylase (regulator of RNase III)